MMPEDRPMGDADVHANRGSDREYVPDLDRGTHSRGRTAVHVGSAALVGVAGDIGGLDHHARARAMGLENAVGARYPGLSLWLGNRRVERRLDHVLGRD